MRVGDSKFADNHLRKPQPYSNMKHSKTGYCYTMKSFFLFLLALTSACAEVEVPTVQQPVRLNTVGYLPDAQKIATIETEALLYAVVSSDTGETVMTGDLRGMPVPASTSADNKTNEEKTGTPLLKTADFSGLSEPGRYRLVIGDGEVESAEFEVGDAIYSFPFRTAVRAMYLWRCGTAVEGEHNGDVFAHKACHLQDGYMDYVTGEHGYRYSIGGWHDAGDYNKYVSNAGLTVFSMLRAWEDFQEKVETVVLDLPEKGGAIPEFLAEVKWELDWVMTMQEKDGSVYHKLSTLGFGPFINPEDEKEPRYLTKWGSTSTANFVAMMAMAARIYQPYDDRFSERCLVAALKSYDFLLQHPEYVKADMEGFHTGSYDSPDEDDRLWAAAELWATTGQASILEDVETRIRAFAMEFDTNFDWGNNKNLGLFTYLASTREGRDAALVTALQQAVLTAADHVVAATVEHPYARGLGDKYYWGCNGTVARQVHLLEAAYRVEGKPAYKQASLDAVNHLFGRNVHGRSYITGLGALPPMHPHDRRVAEDGVEAPWPGYLVGGANPKAEDWFDELASYRTNEIAINWNGALIYALAAVMK